MKPPASKLNWWFSFLHVKKDKILAMEKFDVVKILKV
ncbi:hypothetical protein N783_19950 [Pontibacillus marinus BH030004 = DSM 16465]|uniref:Uncharacterized protein n=1 Tax=Pontibacillus marinus BH030004 = DSM 16465 TaxID=1385511 RepID=A0A0A5GF63_9BACI|nr:hypothetical protein N783_19950 [Pontibacillus marinus BH030004 = DSM 16465]